MARLDRHSTTDSETYDSINKFSHTWTSAQPPLPPPPPPPPTPYPTPFVECVSKIKHIISVIYYTICGAVFFQLWWLREYILCIIIIKSEVWTITHCLGLSHETMVSAVCLSTFSWERTTFSNQLCQINIVVFWLKFHWNFILRVWFTSSEHWFR